MRKLFSIAYSEWAFNLSMFLLRVGAGILIIPHGYSKLINFATYKSKFMNFMGLGSTVSLSLTIFVEFFCAAFLILGLFSRAVAFLLLFVMAVALFKAHGGDVFGKGETSALFLMCFSAILLCGPGKASIDAMIR